MADLKQAAFNLYPVELRHACPALERFSALASVRRVVPFPSRHQLS